MITVKGKMIPTTIKQIVNDLKAKTGYFNDIKDVGDNLMVTCPKHSNGQERNSSCGILKEDKVVGDKTINAGKVHCYTCNYTADITKLVSDVLGYENAQEGFNWLLKTYMSINTKTNKRPPIKLNLSRETHKRKENIIPDIVIERNNKEFNNNIRAIRYMEGRGISKETCNRFKIGYNKYRDTIMIPITKDNKVIFYKERAIDRKVFLNQKGINKADYIFGLDEAKKHKRKVWICESEIDALTVYERGDIAIAIMGSHISNNQLQLLINSPIRHLIDGLDRDKPGRKGYSYLKNRAIKYGFRFFNTNWEGVDKKDINETTQEEYNKIKINSNIPLTNNKKCDIV